MAMNLIEIHFYLYIPSAEIMISYSSCMHAQKRTKPAHLMIDDQADKLDDKNDKLDELPTKKERSHRGEKLYTVKNVFSKC